MSARIQRRRSAGSRMPADAVYVGRPSRWGNPFIVGDAPGQYTRESSLALFRIYATNARRSPDWLEPLRGRDLACWCPLDQPCHADILLELANP